MEQPNAEPPSQATGQGRVDAFCQRAILASILFILVWAPLAFGSTGPAAFLVIQGVTVLALALWAVRWWAQRPFRLFWPPVCWGVLAFLLYALARCQWVDVRYVGHEQLMRVIVYAALFFLVLNNLNRKDSATIVAMALIIVGFGLAFLAVVQFVKHEPTIWSQIRPLQYLARGSATFFNPNNFAGYLEMIVPLALAFTIMSRLGATIKVLLAYAVLAMLAGIMVSLSRGGILAMAATLVLLCVALLIQRDFWLPAMVALAALLVLGIVFADQFDSVQRRFARGIDTVKIDPSDRVFYWKAARQLYTRNPAWGIGPGHFDVEFPLVRPTRVQNRPEYVHDDYLNTLCEWGAAGLGIVAATCALLAWGAVRTWRAVRRPANDFAGRRSDRTAFLVGASAGLVAAMLHCIVDFNMQIPADAITAIVLMALIAAHTRFVTEGYWKNPGFVGKILLTALAAGAVCYLTAEVVHKGRETFWLRKAKTRNISWDQSLLCLKKAHEIDPTNPQTDYLLGESLRLASKQGNPDYQDKARQAIECFGKGLELNPFDARFPVRLGMCLDWIGRPQEATPYFELAERLDPNNYYIALEEGRHFVAAGDFEKAKASIARSLKIDYTAEALSSWMMLMKNMADPLYMPHK
ncbi:MAG TPA: O-antigen ligase family protein [Candidatus Baltobacteraceae bacterium]|nr:O-antigen ligase family protein [Candidatus Baltobacteraceae bacterium]